MRIVDRDEMREIDRRTIEEYGIPGEILMENAGMEFVNAFLRDFSVQKTDRIAVVCGGGNNGGDGFVIARHLKRRGFGGVAVFLCVHEKKLKNEARINYQRLGFFNINVRTIETPELFNKEKSYLYGCSFIIDALLGLGFHGIPRGVVADIIDFTRNCGVPVISVDLPSGVDANAEETGLHAMQACATYTVGMLKFGIVEYPGKALCGKLAVLDIGFPPDLIEADQSPVLFIDADLVKKLVPQREKNSHKGTYGHLGVLGGRDGFEGAALLAARAGSRSGCGLVTVFFKNESMVRKPDEIILGLMPGSIDSLPENADFERIFKRQDALVSGPGMGVFDGALMIIRKLLQLDKKLLVDADGLNNIAKNPDILKNKKARVVVTPHIGEMARLTGTTNSEVKKNKREIAARFSAQYDVTVVLKDAVTVVADGKETFYNDGGVPALAKGGSGDVLSGIIGALMARGLSCRDAAVAGVFLHTECGKRAEEVFTEDAAHAGDLIELLPYAFRQLGGKR